MHLQHPDAVVFHIFSHPNECSNACEIFKFVCVNLWFVVFELPATVGFRCCKWQGPKRGQHLKFVCVNFWLPVPSHKGLATNEGSTFAMKYLIFCPLYLESPVKATQEASTYLLLFPNCLPEYCARPASVREPALSQVQRTCLKEN